MRVLIADDHPLYLDAARSNVERNFSGVEIVEARSFDVAIAHVRDSEPFDFILLDYFMPGMNGAAGVSQMVAVSGGAAVAVMSGGALQEDVGACVAAGAKGFLPKTLDAAMFTAAVNMILIGGTYIPAEFVGAPSKIANPDAAGEIHNLSAREIEVLEMIVGGATNKEIARKLEIQEVTVKLHANRIFNKLGVKNRAQAAVKALEEKLVRR
jgi:DNA-binding NarL/FixJ family response regulator